MLKKLHYWYLMALSNKILGQTKVLFSQRVHSSRTDVTLGIEPGSLRSRPSQLEGVPPNLIQNYFLLMR